MLKSILFDLDNTLIDFLTFKKETAKAAAKAMVAHGLKMSETEAYGKIFSVYDEKGIEYQKTFFEVLKPLGLDINQAEKIQQAAIIAYLKRKFEVLRPYPMVKPTLSRLREKGLKLGIVTDAPRNKAWQRLVLSGLENEFDFVITLDDTLNKKPHPTPFKLAIEKLEMSASDCLFVGDNPEADIKGAKDAGMKTCLAAYGQWKKSKETSDYTIQRFSELEKIVESLERVA